MDSWINRQGVLEALYSEDAITLRGVVILKTYPAADVRPVVRGKWELGGMFGDIGRCSNCHYMFPVDTAISEFHYCPNCGADMREVEHD